MPLWDQMPRYKYRWYDYYGDDPRRLPRSKYKRRRCCGMSSGWTLVKISLLLCCVALVLQILGFACPGWMILSIDLSGLGAPASGLFGFGKITTYAAVWYVRVCTNNGQQETCESSTYHEASFMGLQLSNALSEFASVDWVAIEVETTIALVLCLAGIILCVVSLFEPCVVVSPKQWAVIVAGLMFASGIILLPAVISMSEATDKAKSAVQVLSGVTGQDFIKIEIPWAMALTASGMVLAFICCFLLLIAACLHHNERPSEIIRSGSSDSDCSYRKQPFVMPTRFSSYPPMPMSGIHYKDRAGIASSGRRDVDFPVSYGNFPAYYDPDHRDFLIYAPSIDRRENIRHPGERPVHESRPPGHRDFLTYPPSIDRRENIHHPGERAMHESLPPGHRDFLTYPPSIDRRENIHHPGERPVYESLPPDHRDFLIDRRERPVHESLPLGHRDFLIDRRENIHYLGERPAHESLPLVFDGDHAKL